MVKKVYDSKTGLTFDSQQERSNYYRDFKEASEKFMEMYDRVIHRPDISQEFVDDLMATYIRLSNDDGKMDYQTFLNMRDMIDMSKYPKSAYLRFMQSHLLSKNSGKSTSPRTEVRGRDIIDMSNPDEIVIDKDPEKFRKKKHLKSKSKRKIVKKCKCR
jgi:hypothetical protein